ncbi:helix-turn-helix domain-containing protein [Lewinella sp. LCG006]|uniref:helix-turn-helix domain-containing protein n=1 Tax=Lewinella sp. LCG006 TaxID=3231911 RepID=UPI00346141FB
MRKKLAIIVVFGLCLLPLTVVAQLTVIIKQLPDYTPQADSIYLAGSFNDWNPKDQNFRFQKLTNGRWQYNFLTPMPDFEFKITRGSWSTVEGGVVSEPIPNRFYSNTGKQKDTLRITISGWEDQKEEIPYQDTLPIRVTGLPENTPIDASLYVVGSFNGWSPGDPDFKMERDSNGHFRTTIPIRTNITEFKISRGNWNTIESRENGLARPNRLFNYSKDNKQDLLHIEVANWEDLAGNRINWYAMVLLLAALQGILLVIAINSFKERHRRTNRILSFLIIVLSITFLARIGAFDRDIFQNYPKIILLPDLIYFTYGPLFWLYLRSLTPNWPYRWRWFWHFLPLTLVFLFYLPQIFKTNFDFITQVVNLQLRPTFIGVAAIGLLFSMVYWLRGRQFLRQLNTNYAADGLPILSFLRTVFFLHTLCLIVWLSTYLVGATGLWFGFNWTPITDRMTDATWIILAVGAYTMGYYAMRQPQIFRSAQLNLPAPSPTNISEEEATPEATPLASLQSSPVLAPPQEEFRQLEQLMEDKRPYLNPSLSLGELADLAQTPSHQLSKLINDQFGKNFFDYINSHRIKSFQQRIDKGDHQERTILSLALEAGFNSKTAFNRAFKKQTGLTPREYLRQHDNP